MGYNVGLEVVEGISNGLTAFTLPSKRNIGLIGERVRGADNYPIRISSLQEDSLKFGGFDSGMYGPIVSRNLFRNSKSSPTVYFVRIVGGASSSAYKTTTITGTAITFTSRAGQKGREDKGSWGNDLEIYLYAYNTLQGSKWVVNVLYKSKLVETWSGATVAEIENAMNLDSDYGTISFDAEPNTAICSQTATGTITTTSGAVSEVLATAKFRVSTAGTAGNLITVLAGNTTVLGTYTVQNSDTTTLVATGIKNAINAGTHGYSASSSTNNVTITGPTGSGAYLNGISLTFSLVGTVATTEAVAGDYLFVNGVTEQAEQLSDTVTGVATLFTTQLSVGSALFSTDGVFIGVVESITNNTELVLESVATVILSADSFKFSPFYKLGGALSGGTYLAPTESEYNAVASVTDPKGFACFDGQDVQIIANTDNHTITMAQKGEQYCSDRKDCIYLATLPLNASESTIRSYATQFQSANPSFISGYNVWVKTSDGNNGYVWAPGIGCVLGAAFIRNVEAQGGYIHIPPAGFGSSFVDIIDVAPRLITQTTLNKYTQDYTTNSVCYQQGIGFFVMTSRTYSTNPLFNSIHIRMQSSYYVRVLKNNLGWAIQRPNTPELKDELHISCRNFFKTEYDNGALERSIPFTSACVIICDQTNNPVSQDRKVVNLDIDWIPTETTESIRTSLNRNDGQLLVQTLSDNN